MKKKYIFVINIGFIHVFCLVVFLYIHNTVRKIV